MKRPMSSEAAITSIGIRKKREVRGAMIRKNRINLGISTITVFGSAGRLILNIVISFLI